MHNTHRSFVIVATVFFVLGSLVAVGAQSSASAEGELLHVDPDAMTFVIRTADGNEQEFAYTEETEVTGDEGPAGLGTMTGQHVVVHYEESSVEGTPSTATKIERSA